MIACIGEWDELTWLDLTNPTNFLFQQLPTSKSFNFREEEKPRLFVVSCERRKRSLFSFYLSMSKIFRWYRVNSSSYGLVDLLWRTLARISTTPKRWWNGAYWSMRNVLWSPSSTLSLPRRRLSGIMTSWLKKLRNCWRETLITLGPRISIFSRL